MELTTTLILLTLTTFAFIWFWLRTKYTYWKSRGVPTPPYTIPFGNMKNSILAKSSFGESMLEIYNYFRAKKYNFGGIYIMFSPIFVPINIDLIKSIMQSDFQYFVDRGVYFNEKSDPLSAHLFSLEGRKWKLLRHKLTPTFTSGKIKMMFQTALDCTRGLNKVIDQEAGKGVDIKDVLGRFTTDIIGSCAFGLDCNSLGNPDSLFREKGKQILSSNAGVNFKEFLAFAMPSMMRFLNYKVFPVDVSKFFMDIVKDTVNYREKNDVVRKDFMHLLIQLKNRGKLVDDEKISVENISEEENKITIEEIAAQALVFFLAGFETSSTTMTFCLYELARHENIQRRVRSEIKTILDKYNGKLTYEAVGEMQYLEQCIEETLRKYPPLPVLNRVCTKNYKVPGTDLILKKGLKLIIPIIGIHHDPEYYPEPEKFDPDRFSEHNKRTRPAFSHLPFGEGPRVCIGTRFGMLQSKIGIISLLINYEVSVDDKTKEPIEFEPESFIVTTKGGIWLDFKKIQTEITQHIFLRNNDEKEMPHRRQSDFSVHCVSPADVMMNIQENIIFTRNFTMNWYLAVL